MKCGWQEALIIAHTRHGRAFKGGRCFSLSSLHQIDGCVNRRYNTWGTHWSSLLLVFCFMTSDLERKQPSQVEESVSTPNVAWTCCKLGGVPFRNHRTSARDWKGQQTRQVGTPPPPFYRTTLLLIDNACIRVRNLLLGISVFYRVHSRLFSLSESEFPCSTYWFFSISNAFWNIHTLTYLLWWIEMNTCIATHWLSLSSVGYDFEFR